MINWVRSLIRLVKINTIDNSQGLLRAQVINQGEVDDTILYNPYGFISSPPVKNAIAIQVLINGEAGSKYALPMNPSLNPKIERGEACIFSERGIKIYLKQDGSLDISAPENISVTSLKDVNVTAVNLVANTSGNANVSATGDVNITAANLVANISGDASITATNINLTGNVNVTGDMVVTGNGSIAGKDFLTHTHSGVTVGGGVTGSVV